VPSAAPSVRPSNIMAAATTATTSMAGDVESPLASAPTPEVSFVRADGSAALLSLKTPDSALDRSQPLKLRRFYKSQNDMIDAIVADMMETPLQPVADTRLEGHTWLVKAAVNGSFALNLLLLGAKLFAAVASGSMSAMASAADSLLDLVSGGVLFAVERAMARADPYMYPEGKARLEPLGVIVFAAVMAMSSLQIVAEAVKRLVATLNDGTTLELGPATVAILSSTIVFKLVAMLACRAIARSHASAAVEAYAQDHRNDVLTNSVGVGAVLLAWWQPSELAFVDPLGAILIALWIITSWTGTALDHIAKLAGRVAPPEFVRRLIHIVYSHDARVLKVDTCRAYHFGEKFLVEVEIVMSAHTPLRESHDVGIALQHRIERLEEVERAFVHVDYRIRDVDDHDPHMPLARKTVVASCGAAAEDDESVPLVHMRGA